MGFITQAVTKFRNLVNRATRPSAVTQAQHRHLKMFPKCSACGNTSGGQAHHVKPYHKFPDLAADPSNFITLCERVGGLECHLHVGHGGNFKTYNPDVISDAALHLMSDDVHRQGIIFAIRAKRKVDAP